MPFLLLNDDTFISSLSNMLFSICCRLNLTNGFSLLFLNLSSSHLNILHLGGRIGSHLYLCVCVCARCILRRLLLLLLVGRRSSFTYVPVGLGFFGLEIA
ncbi:hypothetical protein BO83DRAFT_240084 [Aspergillus eucalypticola CBS 122712]|uniref:Uncharacterized protein n=1 Tax=Aspergillus eucalypticola (strain CBS 122712 / IBT 29274) TaxID=1448314 RepID=A0A317VR80_ASPEC|nr:uncharacterized protein BO83DRAFT_240084 [Aspergillus eucalypticola CBS 122712]PWY76816.1 hypothetical protein BO83DRAFT_240084 [Aspergillus eucalypticola CBS 122712]